MCRRLEQHIGHHLQLLRSLGLLYIVFAQVKISVCVPSRVSQIAPSPLRVDIRTEHRCDLSDLA